MCIRDSVKIGPVDEDFKEGGLQFIDEVKGGNIPKEFIPSVQKGFTTAMKNGVLATLISLILISLGIAFVNMNLKKSGGKI